MVAQRHPGAPGIDFASHADGRGLAGRVYVFSSEFGVPEKGDGSVAVDLYDVSNPQPGVQPKRLERWQLDAGNLSKVIRKDKIGWGYTLFLPWSTIREGISSVHLAVKYTPKAGAPLFFIPSSRDIIRLIGGCR